MIIHLQQQKQRDEPSPVFPSWATTGIFLESLKEQAIGDKNNEKIKTNSNNFRNKLCFECVMSMMYTACGIGGLCLVLPSGIHLVNVISNSEFCRQNSGFDCFAPHIVLVALAAFFLFVLPWGLLALVSINHLFLLDSAWIDQALLPYKRRGVEVVGTLHHPKRKRQRQSPPKNDGNHAYKAIPLTENQQIAWLEYTWKNQEVTKQVHLHQTEAEALLDLEKYKARVATDPQDILCRNLENKFSSPLSKLEIGITLLILPDKPCSAISKAWLEQEYCDYKSIQNQNKNKSNNESIENSLTLSRQWAWMAGIFYGLLFYFTFPYLFMESLVTAARPLMWGLLLMGLPLVHFFFERRQFTEIQKMQEWGQAFYTMTCSSA